MNPGKVVDAYRARREPAPRHRLPPAAARRRISTSPTTTAASPRALRCVGVGECRQHGRRHDVPELHGHPRGEALHARPRAAAVRDAAGRAAAPAAGRTSRARRRSTSASRARAARASARSTSTWRPTRPSSCRTTTRAASRPLHAYAFGLIYSLGAAGGAMRRARRTWSRRRPACAAVAEARRRHRAASARSRLRAARRSSAWFGGARPRGIRRAEVLLWPDTFNNHFHPGDRAAPPSRCWSTPASTCASRERALCCGRPLYDYGMLDTAQAPAARDPRRRCGRRSAPACRSSASSRAASPSSATSC